MHTRHKQLGRNRVETRSTRQARARINSQTLDVSLYNIIKLDSGVLYRSADGLTDLNVESCKSGQGPD